MNSSIISAETARELDSLAQTINPILFWTCNYEPTPDYALSEDARFFIGVQDLYKFVFDTNCIVKGIAFNSKRGICQNLLPAQDANTLRSIVETVQMLRSVLDHNHSDLNGKMDSDELDAHRGWIRAKLGKDKPAVQEDFAELNMVLNSMGVELVRLSEQVITCIKGRQDVDEIAEKWIQATLRWYCIGTHQSYYRSQLCDLYYARGCEHRSNFGNNIDARGLVFRTNRWIDNWATHEFDSALKKLEDERKDLRERINTPPPMMLQIREQYPEQYKKTTKSWQCRMTEIDNEIAQIREKRNRFEQKCYDEYGTKIDYFFDNGRLYDQLCRTLDILQSNHTAFTLLPQDFLYFDVAYNFQGVRVPNGDFRPL